MHLHDGHVPELHVLCFCSMEYGKICSANRAVRRLRIGDQPSAKSSLQPALERSPSPAPSHWQGWQDWPTAAPQRPGLRRGLCFLPRHCCAPGLGHGGARPRSPPPPPSCWWGGRGRRSSTTAAPAGGGDGLRARGWSSHGSGGGGGGAAAARAGWRRPRSRCISGRPLRIGPAGRPPLIPNTDGRGFCWRK